MKIPTRCLMEENILLQQQSLLAAWTVSQPPERRRTRLKGGLAMSRLNHWKLCSNRKQGLSLERRCSWQESLGCNHDRLRYGFRIRELDGSLSNSKETTACYELITTAWLPGLRLWRKRSKRWRYRYLIYTIFILSFLFSTGSRGEEKKHLRA